MRKIQVVALAFVLATLAAASPAAAQATDDIRSPQPPSGGSQGGPAGPVWKGPQALLLDSGPLVTHVGGGFGGADASRVQNSSLGMTTLGSNVSLSLNYKFADDFTVPASGWSISTMTFFAYQTGTSTCSLNDVRVQIYNGPPNAGGTVVFGDTTTNRLASCALANIYRDSETTPADASRPIQAATATVATTLAAGTYWVEFQIGGTGASGPWCPPITITGSTTTGNALQWNGTAWSAFNDGATLTPQGVRFVVDGVLAPVELERFSID